MLSGVAEFNNPIEVRAAAAARCQVQHGVSLAMCSQQACSWTYKITVRQTQCSHEYKKAPTASFCFLVGK